MPTVLIKAHLALKLLNNAAWRPLQWTQLSSGYHKLGGFHPEFLGMKSIDLKKCLILIFNFLANSMWKYLVVWTVLDMKWRCNSRMWWCCTVVPFFFSFLKKNPETTQVSPSRNHAVTAGCYCSQWKCLLGLHNLKKKAAVVDFMK